MKRLSGLCLLLLAVSSFAVINVHIIPHSHDDVGWLKTVDQYYAGLNNSIQWAAVHLILDQVVTGLSMNPARKFLYTEQAFFQRWYREQNPTVRQLTKKLVANGQLSFLNGGWCMHDEAAPHYVDMVDQTTLGHRFISSEFGVSAMPDIQWQVDPFGHSGAQASLLTSAVGYNGLFFGRIDYQDRALRIQNKTLEVIWRGSASLGSDFEVFSGNLMGGTYCNPNGFSFDSCSGDTLIQDNPKLEDYNVNSRVDDFVREMSYLAGNGYGPDVMMMMGCDFQWSAGLNYFNQVDKLIAAVNKDGRMRAFYSTPADYVRAKHAYKDASGNSPYVWQLKTDDYFPYADCPHCYWTGYFVSRAALKRYVRTTSSSFTAYRQMVSATGVTSSSLESLAEALGVLQHHDAVAGTAKQHVAFDYARRLARGLDDARPVVMTAIQKLTSVAGAQECPLLNVSICPQTSSGSFTVVVWNPLGQSVVSSLRIPVSTPQWTLAGTAVDTIPSQESFSNYGPQDALEYTIVMPVSLPPLGFKTFTLQPATTATGAAPSRGSTKDTIVVKNSQVSATFSNGHLVSMTVSGVTVVVNQRWGAYSSYANNNDQNSGAYIFRPFMDTSRTPCGKLYCELELVSSTAILSSSGTTVGVDSTWSSAGWKFSNDPAPWVRQRITVPPTGDYVEVSYTVGPIPAENVGLEVTTAFDTDVLSGGVFYTDSNGRDFMQRRFNQRLSWNLTVTEPIGGNFYPLNAAMHLGDSRRIVGLLTDASIGATSLTDGSMEVMVHRRVMADDGRGVGEPLNETEYIHTYGWDGYNPPCQGCHYGRPLIVRGGLRLVAGTRQTALQSIRTNMDKMYGDVKPFFAPDQGFQGASSLMATALPINVNLMTFELLDGSSLPEWITPTPATGVLIRLAHQYEVSEAPNLGVPVVINIASLFKNSTVSWSSAYETTLTAQWPVSRLRERLTWASKPNPYSPPPPTDAKRIDVSQVSEYKNVRKYMDSTITLHPMEVRTFILV